jgi:hypothetical protein
LFAATIETVGKQQLEQSGKYRVNKNDEWNFTSCALFPRNACGLPVIARSTCDEAIQFFLALWIASLRSQ